MAMRAPVYLPWRIIVLVGTSQNHKTAQQQDKERSRKDERWLSTKCNERHNTSTLLPCAYFVFLTANLEKTEESTLSDLFTVSSDTVIEACIDHSRIKKIMRYVEKYLTGCHAQPETNNGMVDPVAKTSRKSSRVEEWKRRARERWVSLTLVWEEDMTICAGSLCHGKKEGFSRTAPQALSSACSKLVKKGVASSCLSAVLKKSCKHLLAQSVQG